jgi:arylsulfatase A-like enzyme
MKVLTIFIDMIRANRLSTFNNNVQIDTPLDKAFKELGGTVYTNCFTPGADTPRGMSTYYTGLNPYINGCNTRLKWPQYFLKKDLNTVFDLFIDKNYKMNIFSAPNERDTGLFPSHINDMDIHNSDYDMNKYLSSMELQKDHFVFISVPDYHWAFDDFGYSTRGEEKAYDITKNVYDIIFKNLNKDDFDHIFIFSDHGFKFMTERQLEPKSYMLNEDRTNSIMIHREKGQNTLTQNDKLCSLADLYPAYEEILNMEQTNSISLLSRKEHEFIILEDHIDFAPSINQNIELWALVNKDLIYIRELDKAIMVDRRTREVKNGIIEKYDDVLKETSSFNIYIDEYEKIFRYRDNILSKNVYMNGVVRGNTNKVKKYFYIFLDLIKLLINKFK